MSAAIARWIVLALVGCSGGAAPFERGGSDPPVCDGLLQDDEGLLADSAFDRDGDGYFDGSDPGCAATYSEFALDCDDGDYFRHPDAPEQACNDTDDDCNDDTPDALDIDEDGTLACDDCDDKDPSRFPGAGDRCWDGIDNDCDGVIDPGCGPNYNGSFALDQELHYRCASSLIEIDFASIGVIWNPPYAAMFPQEGLAPGTLDGTIDADGTFLFEGSTQAACGPGCDQYYRFSGSFTDPDHLVMTFEAVFIGGTCFNCTDQTITDLHGTRTD